jgi:hypothetical protein
MLCGPVSLLLALLLGFLFVAEGRGAVFLGNVDFHRTTQRYIPEDGTFCSHFSAKLNSNLMDICTKVLDLLHTATDRQTCRSYQ